MTYKDIVDIFDEASSQRGYESDNPDNDDWSDTLDDLDADDWENHYEPENWGIEYSDLPEDDSEDTEYEDVYEEPPTEEFSDDDYYWEEIAYGDIDKHVAIDPDKLPARGRIIMEEILIEPESFQFLERRDIMSRKEEIVAWLSKSTLAKSYKKGEGFFVLRGERVRLQDGTEKEVLIWLFKEGITDGDYINGYSVAHTKPCGPYQERLSFFKTDKVVDVPF